MRKQTANKSYNISANALQYSSHLHQSLRFANSPIPEHFWWVWYIHFSVAHSSTSNHAIRLGREGHQDFSSATYYRMLCVCYVVGCVSQFFFVLFVVSLVVPLFSYLFLFFSLLSSTWAWVTNKHIYIETWKFRAVRWHETTTTTTTTTKRLTMGLWFLFLYHKTKTSREKNK